MADLQQNNPRKDLQNLSLTYSHLFLRAADAFLIWDSQGIIRNANAAACLLTGYNRDQLLESDHKNLFPESIHSVLDNILTGDKSISDGDILYEGENNLISKESEEIPVTLRFISVMDSEHKSVLGIIHDIRDLKDLEARLALSQARYKSIVENVNETIIMIDKNGRILFVNKTGELLLNRERNSLIEKKFHDFVCEKGLNTLTAILNGEYNNILSAEERPTLRICSEEGKMLEMRLHNTFIPDERNQPGGYLMIMHDVTGQRELKEKLKYAERLQSVEDILSKITHEVKNPLAAINASAEFLRRHWEVDESQKREVVDLIADETTRINKIITDYLRVRRVPKPTLLEYNLSEIIDSLIKTLDKLLESKPDIRIKTDIEDINIVIDGDMIKQVLWNLINNAFDALADNGIVEINGITDKSRNLYILTVKDNGCGMDKETMARAFDPFFTSKESGTGIGLAMVKQQINAMNGQVMLQSQPGIGTSCLLELPTDNEATL